MTAVKTALENVTFLLQMAGVSLTETTSGGAPEKFPIFLP